MKQKYSESVDLSEWVTDENRILGPMLRISARHVERMLDFAYTTGRIDGLRRINERIEDNRKARVA